MKTKQELKAMACDAIDRNRDRILAVGDSVFNEPEMGYKEFKTADKVKKALAELGVGYRDGIAITGVVAPLAGKEPKLRLSVMGELDAVAVPQHPFADKTTGAAHACGHHCMIAALLGVAYGLHGTGVMEHLSGDVVLMAVPAEEFVELEYRSGLRDAGQIQFLGGKQEFVRLGEMDGIDMMIMQHTGGSDEGYDAGVGSESTGFVGKMIRYVGREAHAGGGPHQGINALNAANIGMMAVQCQRETFQDKDRVRVHPIITKGGDLVNVVPADVRLETFVRAANMEAILDANAKVTRAFRAGGDAVGAETVIADFPGYLPMVNNDGLCRLMCENMKAVLDPDKVRESISPGAGSTDAGDISVLMPALHAYFNGATGTGHGADYATPRKDIAYIAAAKCLAMTAIDLLADGAKEGLKIKRGFTPSMTMQAYLKDWCGLDG